RGIPICARRSRSPGAPQTLGARISAIIEARYVPGVAVVATLAPKRRPTEALAPPTVVFCTTLDAGLKVAWVGIHWPARSVKPHAFCVQMPVALDTACRQAPNSVLPAEPQALVDEL